MGDRGGVRVCEWEGGGGVLYWEKDDLQTGIKEISRN